MEDRVRGAEGGGAPKWKNDVVERNGRCWKKCVRKQTTEIYNVYNIPW